MTRSPDAIEASYAACRQAARRARSSFYPSFLLLNGPKRRAMEAVYATLKWIERHQARLRELAPELMEDQP